MLALSLQQSHTRPQQPQPDQRFGAALALGEKLRGGLGRAEVLEKAAAKRTSWRGSRGGHIQLWTGSSLERLDIDEARGPRVLLSDGSMGFMTEAAHWPDLHSSDQKVLAYRAAQTNRRMAAVVQERQAALKEEAWEAAADASPEARRSMRCERERGRPPLFWTPIGMEVVMDGHARAAPGMFYGLEFPWSEETMEQFGPAWLTLAFHTAGSMSKENAVTRVSVEPTKITAGNNSGKFLFEVEYKLSDPSLHTKLFAKVPFPLSAATKSDRISSSVYKQPMDFYEINTYRLFETSFPMKTPRFYYGDISNETSNFILITERIDFAELNGVGLRELGPGEIEGPYEKCKDFHMHGLEKEYYDLLLSVSARIAAHHKTGKFGSDELLGVSLVLKMASGDPWTWGCNPSLATGNSPPAEYLKKLSMAYEFVSSTASVLYPAYVKEQAFREKFVRTMMTRFAYSAEIDYWKHEDADYVALGHQNLNIDNAFFWRDVTGKLDCGVYDWGGFGSSCLGHKIYWMFNCSEFEQFRENLETYLQLFVEVYRTAGGPALSQETLRKHVLLTALENMHMMVLAVPNCYTMCSAREWESIQDRWDPRIADNVGGKSTLRTTLHCLGNGLRIIEELDADKVLQSWIHDVYVGQWGLEAKSEAILFGS